MTVTTTPTAGIADNAVTAAKAPVYAGASLGGPTTPQGTPSARTAEETKGNGRFRAVLVVARCRHM